jgi:hypothetical protein
MRLPPVSTVSIRTSKSKPPSDEKRPVAAGLFFALFLRTDELPAAARLWKRCAKRSDKQRKVGAVDPQLEAFRWHIEELCVSLFAQELKTPYPVS